MKISRFQLFNAKMEKAADRWWFILIILIVFFIPSANFVPEVFIGITIRHSRPAAAP